MKVTDVVTTETETSSEIDLVSTIRASEEAKERIKEEVGAYLLEQTLLAVGNYKSPVEGYGQFADLEEKYKKKKRQEGGTPKPNLEMTGSMLGALDVEITDDGVKIGVFGKEAPKADGHNNLSGESLIPTRRFLPDEGENYTAKIAKGVNEIINDILADESSASEKDFEGVTTTDELYDVLEEITGISGKAAITRAVLANEDLLDLLNDLNLLDLIDA